MNPVSHRAVNCFPQFPEVEIVPAVSSPKDATARRRIWFVGPSRYKDGSPDTTGIEFADGDIRPGPQ